MQPTFLDAHAIDELVTRARSSPRRRLNLNLHPELSDPIQRLLNAGEPGSYVRPHRHVAERWELFVVLRGRIDVLLFSDEGVVTQRFALEEGSGVAQIPGGQCHALAFKEPGSVALEIKPGPYDPSSDKNFASWAPHEEDPGARQCESWLASAEVGQRWTPRNGVHE